MWAAPGWAAPAGVIGVCLVAFVFWSWSRSGAKAGWAALGVSLKIAAVALLLAVILEPMRREETAEPKANIVLVLVDNSQSLEATGPSDDTTWGDELRRNVAPTQNWRQRLETDFDVRLFQFDRRLKSVTSLDGIDGTGTATDLSAAMRQLEERFSGRPVAAGLLITDGIATDAAEANATANQVDPNANGKLAFPWFPIAVGGDRAAPDIRISRVTSSQTNFEAAPITVAAEVIANGYAGKTLSVKLLNEKGETVEEQKLADLSDDKPVPVRFQVKPDEAGVLFYQVNAAADDAKGNSLQELTAGNNSRLVAVDRTGGPYRVLYVSGRPNWEFKFLRRALEADDEIELVGLIRIAKRQPKFTFRSSDGNSNPLFRGFDSDEELAEAHDEPVLLRLGTKDGEELRGGFPKTAEDLFTYDAVIIDDLEADFFTQDQKELLQRFVSQRGGGFLMLGGQETFQGGDYARSPIGDLLPVYADRPHRQPASDAYRLSLTREGWLETWTRLRTTEAAEQSRLENVPAFGTINRLASIKPGARVLAEVYAADDVAYPALVTQDFGRGRAAALLVGDVWKWQIQGGKDQTEDFQNAWRQTVRWLVADVPKPVEVNTSLAEKQSESVVFRTTVRDESFQLLDNAEVTATVTDPAGEAVTLTAFPIADQSGQYEIRMTPRLTGAYRATFAAVGPDAAPIGEASTGFVFDPTSDELRQLNIDRPLLEDIAKRSQGEVFELGRIDSLVESLPLRQAPVTITKIIPLWHNWGVLLVVMLLLISEWGLRRWKGIP